MDKNPRIKSWHCGLWCCMFMWLDTSVSEDLPASVFRDTGQVTLNMEAAIIPRNVGILRHIYTASQPRKL